MPGVCSSTNHPRPMVEQLFCATTFPLWISTKLVFNTAMTNGTERSQSHSKQWRVFPGIFNTETVPRQETHPEFLLFLEGGILWVVSWVWSLGQWWSKPGRTYQGEKPIVIWIAMPLWTGLPGRTYQGERPISFEPQWHCGLACPAGRTRAKNPSSFESQRHCGLDGFLVWWCADNLTPPGLWWSLSSPCFLSLLEVFCLYWVAQKPSKMILKKYLPQFFGLFFVLDLHSSKRRGQQFHPIS